MTNLLKKIDAHSLKQLFWCLPIAAALLAGWMQYIQHGWINPDSVLYFEAAKLFAVGEWRQGFNIFPWPLYSLCIAVVHKITGLGVQLSAQLLHAIFFSITTFSFLKIIQLTGGGTRVLLAGALILFSSQYLVGDVLEMLLRDQGFWAFHLTSLIFFIKFYQSKTYANALLWQVCAMTATLFRIEAISFLVFLPALLLFNKEAKWPQRINHLIKCNFLNIIAAVSILAAIVLDDMSMSQFGRLKEVFSTNLFAELTDKFFTQSKIMSELVLGKYLEEFAVQGLLLTFIYVMIAKTITAAGLINLGLAAYTYRARNYLMNAQAFQVLKAMAIIATINMALIITKVFVLSSRYAIALGLIVMILASFKLADLLKYLNTTSTSKEKKLKWLTAAILIFMLLGAVKNILPKAEGYNYMQDAGAWVKVNNKENKPVFYDDSRVRYYAGAPFIGTWNDGWAIVISAVNDGSINQYDYLLISHSIKRPELEKVIVEKLPKFKEVRRFNSTKSKKYIVIYQKISN
jgi:hypothetical protein